MAVDASKKRYAGWEILVFEKPAALEIDEASIAAVRALGPRGLNANPGRRRTKIALADKERICSRNNRRVGGGWHEVGELDDARPKLERGDQSLRIDLCDVIDHEEV